MADARSKTVLDDEHPTGELRLDETAQVPTVNSGGADHGSNELNALFEGEPDEWPTQGPAKGLRLPWPVAGLLVLLLVFGGIWAGAYMQRSSSSSSSASSPFGGRSLSPVVLPLVEERVDWRIPGCVNERHVGHGHRHHRKHAVRDDSQRQSGGRQRRDEYDRQSKCEVVAFRPSAR